MRNYAENADIDSGLGLKGEAEENSASFFMPIYGIVICYDVKERLVETR
ncbi:hypothetical protein HMPREF9412_0103 [Paenibacillus sp. HGF5]|nr:hypothetical protein HMPREF9412_0103 [Paenibacillus sp. HGF5]